MIALTNKKEIASNYQSNDQTQTLKMKLSQMPRQETQRKLDDINRYDVIRSVLGLMDIDKFKSQSKSIPQESREGRGLVQEPPYL